jgi:two-component system, NarL family, nitrate/nitrite response regulator NarL
MSRIRVLVVDDVECWRCSISSTLSRVASFEIISEVSDGLKAVQQAETLKPAVVLLDIGLPGLNGIEAGGWIRKLVPACKIVFLTEQFDPDIVKAALNLRAEAYVLKSDIAKDLVNAIHVVAQGEKFVSRQLMGRGLIEVSR